MASTELGTGFLFGIGLIISGMTSPNKVLNFLDLAGNWDPSLIFVMIGGISVAVMAFAFAKKISLSLFGSTMKLPQSKQIDTPLIWGNILFGVGWGISGVCPGPGIVSVGTGQHKAILFVLAMLVGMKFVQTLRQK
jgi:uncharacterized membrane protein YedE/YeeE